MIYIYVFALKLINKRAKAVVQNWGGLELWSWSWGAAML